MAQLADDCFVHGGALLPVDEAGRLMAEHVPPIAEIETVALADAAGRILAGDLAAPIALPGFDNAAVDGYAVRSADVAKEGKTRLIVVDQVFAGDRAGRKVGPGEAIRIFTGASMPAGADTVYMQEDSERDGDAVLVPAGLKVGANRRLAGEDIKSGALALPAGRRLQPQDVALAAALGVQRLSVRRRLRVALISTGNEIAEPGSALPAFGLYDSNRFLLMGLLRKLDVEVDDFGIVRDDKEALISILEAAAATHDLVLSTGGVSTGEADHVKAAVEKLGRLVLWRLAIKPGRPVAMGVIGGKAFVGLPGNPVAVFVTFVHVVRPLLLRLAGGSIEPARALPVRAAFSYRKKKGRREYVRVRLRARGDGTFEAVPHPQDGAGIITSLTETDGLAELAEDRTAVEPDSSVGFLSYRSLID
jgi:molybdopterin molybdotransferase